MLTNETISKLNEMHLGTMASHFAEQLNTPHRMVHAERWPWCIVTV